MTIHNSALSRLKTVATAKAAKAAKAMPVARKSALADVAPDKALDIMRKVFAQNKIKIYSATSRDDGRKFVFEFEGADEDGAFELYLDPNGTLMFNPMDSMDFDGEANPMEMGPSLDEYAVSEVEEFKTWATTLNRKIKEAHKELEKRRVFSVNFCKAIIQLNKLTKKNKK